MKHLNLNNIVFKDINKLNSVILQGYNVINVSEKFNSLIFSLSKPLFFNTSDKLISTNKLSFNNHYSNSSGPFIAGKIENSAVPGFVITTHTSFSKTKFVADSFSQSIINYYVHLQNTNQFNTTLIPTDSIYDGSRSHQNKIFHPLNDTSSITFKTYSVRKGNQNEILKSDLILKSKFNLNNNLVFKGSDNKDYFFNNSLLSNYVTKNNIITDSFALNMISKDDSLSTLLDTRDTSLEKIITGKDKISTIKLKISLDELRLTQAAKKNNSNSIIELGSDGFAANESVQNAFYYSKTIDKNKNIPNNNNIDYFNSIDNINSYFESNQSILEESSEDFVTPNNNED